MIIHDNVTNLFNYLKMEIKHLIFIFLSLININSFSQYDFENKAFNCFEGTARESGIDILIEKDSIENYIIDVGLLKGKTGNDYKTLLQDLIKKPTNLIKIDKFIFEEVQKVSYDPQIFFNCVTSLKQSDSLLFQNSRLKVIQSEFSNNNKIENIEILTFINNILTKEDLDQPFYQFYTYQILNIITSNDFLVKEFNTQNFNKSIVLDLYLDAESKIFISENQFSMNQISKELTSYFKEEKLKYLIRVTTERKTKYADFIKLMDMIQTSYDNFLNTKSLEIHKIEYEKLTETQRSELKEKYYLEVIHEVPK